VAVLQGAGVHNFQCFPARLVDPQTGKEHAGYQLFNVLGVASLPGTEAGGADRAAGGLGGLHMFRLVDSLATLVVDDVVRAALVANRPPEGWGILLEELEAS